MRSSPGVDEQHRHWCGALLPPQTPLRRVGQPEDVANVIAFLASFVSGQVIYVAGGPRG